MISANDKAACAAISDELYRINSQLADICEQCESLGEKMENVGFDIYDYRESFENTLDQLAGAWQVFEDLSVIFHTLGR